MPTPTPLYLGWGALGLLAAAISSFGPASPPLRRSVIGLIALTHLLLVGFLATGYHPITIAISTAVIFAWYVVASALWRLVPGGDVSSVALRAGLVYLVGSSLGVWALAAVQASGGSELAGRLAVHAFLVGFGWYFVFTIVGLVVRHESRLGGDAGVARSGGPPLRIRWAVAGGGYFGRPVGCRGRLVANPVERSPRSVSRRAPNPIDMPERGENPGWVLSPPGPAHREEGWGPDTTPSRSPPED